MKKNIIIVIVLLVIVGNLLTLMALPQIDFSSWKNSADEINSSQTSERVILTVNDQKITEKDFEMLKLALSQSAQAYDDQAIKDELIRRAVIDSEIENHAIKVSEEEVNQFNEQRFAMVYQDESSAAIMDEFLRANNLTLEQYKEQSLVISRKALLAVKLREKLVEDYINSAEYKNSANAGGFNENGFFRDYINNKIDEAIIEIYD